ncbi:MAG: GNAT family N-acetyltransferase [Chloroflexi bacterium CFX4]|nr:GNAT family N-acetyltransferase [Chloroflexi bacterium CFX4]MDL1923394.1 GNAT family N-acetyltransferase [Chloroflexi bacterium CFX3]
MTSPTIEGLRTRTLTLEDASMVAATLNLISQHDVGENWLAEGDLEREWQAPNFMIADNTHALFDGDQLVGYADLWDMLPPHTRAFGFCRVHPDYRGRGIEDYLMRWLLETSRRNLSRAPENARVVLHMMIDSRMQHSISLYERHGLRHIRNYFQMRLNMEAPPPLPQYPEGITVRKFVRGQDDRATFEALDEAFRDHYGHMPGQFEMFEHHMLNNAMSELSMWYLAMAGDEIAGLCLCSKSIPEDPELGWVEDLAVRRPYRKLGLGLALLHESFGEFYRRGYRKVGLGVDAQNLTGALRLYERAGMRPERQWQRYEYVLREGEELSTQMLSE